jgi:hypothetical protein
VPPDDDDSIAAAGDTAFHHRGERSISLDSDNEEEAEAGAVALAPHSVNEEEAEAVVPVPPVPPADALVDNPTTRVYQLRCEEVIRQNPGIILSPRVPETRLPPTDYVFTRRTSPEHLPQILNMLKTGQLSMSAAADEVLETMVEDALVGKRAIYAANIKYRVLSGEHTMLSKPIDPTNIYDDCRFLNREGAYTTIKVANDSSIDLVNVRGIVPHSQRNNTILQKVRGISAYDSQEVRKYPVRTICKGANCTCHYCYAKNLDNQYISAFAMYILGCCSAVDEKTDAKNVANACIFPVALDFNAPAEIRDSTRLWLTAPVYRKLPQRRLYATHIIALSHNIDVVGCDKYGRPYDLPMTCNRWRCINKNHYVKIPLPQADTSTSVDHMQDDE